MVISKKNDAAGKPYKKKSGKKKLLLPVIAFIIIIAFVLMIVIPNAGRKNDRPGNEPQPTATVPEFRHDGNLQFYANNGHDTVEIAVEIVDRQDEINRGLMYRPQMPENSGMLFIFPGEEIRSFWMKDTYISLDIIFVNSLKEIETIQANTQPLSTEPVPSQTPAQYVIEVNAGFVAKHQIRSGDRINFEF